MSVAAVAGAVAVEVEIEDSGRQISTSRHGQHKNPTSLLKLETLRASGDLKPLVLTRETFDNCTKSTGDHFCILDRAPMTPNSPDSCAGR